MGIESATYISDLNEEWPLGSDQKSTLDNHARLTKSVLKNTFPNLSAAVTATAAQINAAVSSGGLSTISSSATSLSLSIATKSLTVETGKGFAPGQGVQINYDLSNYMTGTCTAYDTATGAMSVSVTAFTGSGTYADWDVFVIVPTAPFPDNGPLVKDSTDATKQAVFNAGGITTGTTRTYDLPDKSGEMALAPGDSYVTVSTGNGMGSTNDKIRRFTTVVGSAGSDIVYADSSANGASFTASATGAGIYAITYMDKTVAGTGTLGVSLNSNQLTTAVSSITLPSRLIYAREGAGGLGGVCTVIARLVAGDVIRPHCNAAFDDTTSEVVFTIRKIG